MKTWKKELIDQMLVEGNYFYLKDVANKLGIKQIKRQDVENIITAFLARKPEMKVYFDPSHNNSLFCGTWFAEKNVEFDPEDTKEVNA